MPSSVPWGGMNVIEAAILGLVEGITEYLPISSTGHLIITTSLLGLDDPERAHAVDAFNIVIQGGAILAVLGLYRARVVQMVRGLLGRDRAGARLAVNLAVAFLPAAVVGVLIKPWIDRHLFDIWPVASALAVGGVYMIVLDRWRIRHLRAEDQRAQADGSDPEPHDDIPHLTPGRALVIGLLQVLAMWPGMSRSMMTITGGVLVGLRPKQAAEFSFLLGLPTLGGATVYSLYENLTESPDGRNMFDVLGVVPMLVGIGVATVSAAVAVRWLVGFLNRHGLAGFGYYRLVLCVVLVALAFAGVVDTPG